MPSGERASCAGSPATTRSGFSFTAWLETSATSRTLVLPTAVKYWSLTALREKPIGIDAKVVSHGRCVTFQLAEVAVQRELLRKILRLIDGLRPAPLPP